ncbi:uncharacterized protein B0P05DRAFT_566294 [Gilbertella persicaria]|uniref:uncharacterized protein n=1 Tax=Gilbertella persicaria TaxID=101096 RepID=UPI00222015B9|nr:uncharacterized protein B0P05DRAFT_566294 [Gilbertella persicaria]KAI8047373.1 hypothetical protein B0P05DRAFT_566294 [Gilbertella persicaria]
MYAIVRNIPSSFADCVTSVDNTTSPIDIQLAKKQHDDYVEVVKQHVKHVIQVPEDENHPDCCFVEDNAVVVQDKAIVNFLGAESRRKEVSGVENALKEIPAIKDIVYMHDIDPEATLDGGDVLFTGKHMFVGLSKRTNQAGADVLHKVFSDKCPVYTIKGLVGNDSLHFKCIVSMLNDHTLLVTDKQPGNKVIQEIKDYTQDHYEFIKIPDQVPSNILSLDGGKFVIYQQNYPESEKVILSELEQKRGIQVKSLCMSELIKADGALTCCSILIQ